MQISSQVKHTNCFLSLSNTLPPSSYLNTCTQNTFAEFTTFRESKSYIPVIGCVFDHIISNTSFSNLEKLFYILADSLALINSKNKKQRSVAFSASFWANLLNCSKSQIFVIQRSLESKGYLIIAKNTNTHGQNKRNLLTPILPESIFESLLKASNRVNAIHLSYDNTPASKREYLDKTKLFIPLNYQLLKTITSIKGFSPLQKIIWLDFYSKYYKASNKKLGFSFVVSYQELMNRYGCNKSVLSKALNNLEHTGFITKNRCFFKKKTTLEDRKDKSMWQITISLPNTYMTELMKSKDRIKPESSTNEAQVTSALKYTEKIIEELSTNNEEIPIKQLNIHTLPEKIALKKVSCTDPHISKFSLHINKDLKSNLKYRSDFLENHKLKNKTLADFSSITEQQFSKIISLSNREGYSKEFIEQLTKKLASKYPHHSFFSEKGYITYMAKVLQYEKRTPEQVNFNSYPYLTEKEQAIEKFLAKIEWNYKPKDKANHLERKIAGVFDRNIAYSILLKCDFSCANVEEKTYILPCKDMQLLHFLDPIHKKSLLSQVQAIYGPTIEKIEFVEKKNKHQKNSYKEDKILEKTEYTSQNNYFENTNNTKEYKETKKQYLEKPDSTLFNKKNKKEIELEKEKENREEIREEIREKIAKILHNYDYSKLTTETIYTCPILLKATLENFKIELLGELNIQYEHIKTIEFIKKEEDKITLSILKDENKNITPLVKEWLGNRWRKYSDKRIQQVEFLVNQ